MIYIYIYIYAHHFGGLIYTDGPCHPFPPQIFSAGLCHGGGAAGRLGSLRAPDLRAADPREGLVAQGRPRLGWDDGMLGMMG